MKNVNNKLIGKILFIIGLLVVLTIIVYGAFLAHPLVGIFIIGILLLTFGGILECSNK